MPHAGCYMWRPWLIRLHWVSDSLITLAYYSIPLTLVYFVRKKRDLPYRWMFLMFGAFIVACGTTHLMEVITLYHPIYWVSGSVKAVTAVLSVATAVALIPLVPEALTLRGPGELEAINQRLEREIEERKRGEKRFRLLLDAAPDAMTIVNEKGIIVLVNNQVEKLFQYTREELLGQPIEILIPERFQDKHPEHRRSYSRDPHTRPMGAGLDLYARRKDGTEFPAEISLSPMESEGGMLVTAAIRDVTAQKMAEKALQTTNKELEAFSYSVSHDLRTPLRAIDGFSRELLENYKERLDERGQKDLARIRSATQRMSQLIDDLLNLSRLNISELALEDVDLSALAEQIVEERIKGEPNRSVEFRATPNLTTKGDARLLVIALENLLSNAWKFTQKQPQAKIAFGVTHQNGVKAFFVRDNGVGFNMAYADKLFGVFQRLHDEREFPGTGIGLALVQRIIHRHGGKVWAEAEENKGATFYFTLS